MSSLRKGIQYIGVLDYNRSNQPRVFINQSNRLQFSIKSQEEESFHVQEIVAYPNFFRNINIKENEKQKKEERIHTATEYFKNKLFVFFIDRKQGKNEEAIFPYIVEKPKKFNAKEPFAAIPVFTGKDSKEQNLWNEEREKNGDKVWDLRRTYKDFAGFCSCVREGKTVGEIYGSAKDSLKHPFVLWREEEKFYAVGKIKSYSLEKKQGWTLEGNINRVVCPADILDKIVYDVKINPTLAFVPVSVCKLLEETLEKIQEEIKEESKKKPEDTSAVLISVFAPKNDPVDEEWLRNKKEKEELLWKISRTYKDYSAFKEYLIAGKGLGGTYGYKSDDYDRSFVLWREAGEFYAVGPIVECLTAWRIKINPVHKVRIGKITNKAVYNPEENPTIAKFPVSVYKLIEEKLTELKETEPEPYVSVPIFARKDDPIEKQWFEKEAGNGKNYVTFQRPYKDFSMWLECVKEGKGLSSIYGFLGGYFKQSFVLWREEEALYAVGPIEGFGQGEKGGRVWGNPTEKILISEFTDKAVCDIEENPMLAHIPESVCELIEEKIKKAKWKQIVGVRKSNTSKNWKYQSIEWRKRR